MMFPTIVQALLYITGFACIAIGIIGGASKIPIIRKWGMKIAKKLRLFPAPIIMSDVSTPDFINSFAKLIEVLNKTHNLWILFLITGLIIIVLASMPKLNDILKLWIEIKKVTNTTNN